MNPPARITRTTRLLAVFLLLMMVAAACGSSPTEEEAAPPPAGEGGGAAPETEAAGDGDAGGGAVESGFDAVFAAVEGLEGQERIDKLLELAKEEGQLNVYTSNTDFADMAEVFTDTYDIDVSVYRAQANQVLQRLLQEKEAGYAGADLYDSNAEELSTANAEGLLRDYDGPALEGLVDVADQEGWVASRLNVFTVSWNTDLITEPPTSYEDLADERFKGLIMVEPRAFEWFMTLATYFTEEQGMTDEEVDDLFLRIGANATQVTGNTVHANFLAAGEYGVSTSVYSHLVDQAIAAGAPISHDPAVEPVVIRPNGIALLETAANPASALLLMEWVLTEGQPLIAEALRVPSRTEFQSGELEGVETVGVDIEKLIAEGDQWEARFEEVLREAQQEPAS